MADIVALAGLDVVTTVNGVVYRLTRGRIRASGQTLDFATTGQTLDGDLKAWMNRLNGINSWETEGDGYVDLNATPANRLTGNNIKFRPGTTAAGQFLVVLGPGYGFGGTLVVDQLEVAWDAEANKPITCRVGGKGDGALTYLNT